jgi:hypothetical protein
MNYDNLTLYATFGTPELWQYPQAGAWSLYHHKEGLWFLLTPSTPLTLISDEQAASLMLAHTLD